MARRSWDVAVQGGGPPGGVPAPEVAPPAPQQGVEVGDHAGQAPPYLADAGGVPDLAAHSDHGPRRRPALQVVPAGPAPRLHLSMVEAEEIEALSPVVQVHDAGLVRGRCNPSGA